MEIDLIKKAVKAEIRDMRADIEAKEAFLAQLEEFEKRLLEAEKNKCNSGSSKGLTIAQLVDCILEESEKPLYTREIVERMEKRGYHHSPTSVRLAINRAMKTKEYDWLRYGKKPFRWWKAVKKERIDQKEWDNEEKDPAKIFGL